MSGRSIRLPVYEAKIKRCIIVDACGENSWLPSENAFRHATHAGGFYSSVGRFEFPHFLVQLAGEHFAVVARGGHFAKPHARGYARLAQEFDEVRKKPHLAPVTHVVFNRAFAQ